MAQKDFTLTGPFKARRCKMCKVKRMVMRIAYNEDRWSPRTLDLCPRCLIVIALDGITIGKEENLTWRELKKNRKETI